MKQFFERRYTDERSRTAALTAAREDSELCHKLLGGDRTEGRAWGKGPKGRAALKRLGQPQITGYTHPVDVPDEEGTGGSILVHVGDDVALAMEDPDKQQRLSPAERGRVLVALRDRETKLNNLAKANQETDQ